MNSNELNARIKSGALSGWYILAGEEDYLKKHYFNLIEKTVIQDDTFAPFNLTVFDGQDVDFSAVAEAIEAPPFMSEYKLIAWKYANLDALKESEKSALSELFALKDDHKSSIFVIMTTLDGFDTGTPKKPSKLCSRLAEGFDIISFDKASDSQLLSWLKKHFDAEGISVDRPSLEALIFRSGRSMQTLAGEVEKLSAYLKANGISALSTPIVEKIASASVECDAFTLSNAVLEKNIEKAFLALSDFKMRRIDPSAVIAMLEYTYTDLASVAMLLDEGRSAADIESIMKFHPFKTKLYISSAKKVGAKRLTESLAELRRIDAASKSGGISGFGAVEIFITKNFN